MLVSSQAFDRGDLCTRDLQHGDQATIDQNSICQNGTRTTLAFATAFLGTRQSNLYPQYVQQSFHRKSVDDNCRAVHNQTDIQFTRGLRNVAHYLVPANAGILSCEPFAVRASKISSGSSGMELKETPSAPVMA